MPSNRSGTALVQVSLLVVATTVGLVACADVEPAEVSDSESLGPAETVTELLAAIDEGRFDDAAQLTDAVQAALLSLAEGADASDVVGAIEAGPGPVAANFWSGFAQTLDEASDPAGGAISAGEESVEGSSRFVEVSVTPAEGEDRSFVLRRDGAWQVDLLATFGPTLAERLIAPVEAMLSSANDDASTVLGHLNASADSLRLVAADPDLPAATHQSLLGLIERVTRAGG